MLGGMFIGNGVILFPGTTVGVMKSVAFEPVTSQDGGSISRNFSTLNIMIKL